MTDRQSLTTQMRGTRHVRVLSVQRGLDKYSGYARHLALMSMMVGTVTGAIGRPNRRALTHSGRVDRAGVSGRGGDC
jgi:hypothetical protein